MKNYQFLPTFNIFCCIFLGYFLLPFYLINKEFLVQKLEAKKCQKRGSKMVIFCPNCQNWSFLKVKNGHFNMKNYQFLPTFNIFCCIFLGYFLLPFYLINKEFLVQKLEAKKCQKRGSKMVIFCPNCQNWSFLKVKNGHFNMKNCQFLPTFTIFCDILI